ncbi:glycerophosphodiester phosphodiesterase family protein [Roseomonas sp. 18066]|uniref:glycerophosphodiester phosphodiesterase n=1 Tax=Roseomonas sp. 18066 TaxID=2681412 RepID=UPI001359E1E7|nr:glycerophosphodiester phosphodiesterase family protein [Roseomonas sp. 18066]
MSDPAPTPLRNAPRTAIVSHRGGAFLWPENSLEAFRQSLALPLDQCECDVHLSADGVPMVIHDATLNRTTEGSGPVAALTAAELARLRLRGAGQLRIPTLADVAALFRGSRQQLQVEVKVAPGAKPDPALVDKSLAVLDAAGIRAQVRIIAFEAELAAAALRAGGLAGVIWLFDPRLIDAVGQEGIIGVARAHGFDFVETHISVLDEAFVAKLRAAGLQVGAWGANHGPTIQKGFSLGLDAMATDDPVLALQLRP